MLNATNDERSVLREAKSRPQSDIGDRSPSELRVVAITCNPVLKGATLFELWKRPPAPASRDVDLLGFEETRRTPHGPLKHGAQKATKSRVMIPTIALTTAAITPAFCQEIHWDSSTHKSLQV